MDPEAIFVVGVSRSGTTLMRRVLGGHSRIAIATENHYLGHLLPWEGARAYFRRLGDPQDDATMRRIAAFVYSGEFQRRSRFRELSPYWRWLTSTVPQTEFEDRLLASDRTERGVLTVLMRTFADRKRRPIMGEKTPAHLAWADTLLAWYPDARIVHMIRDPRGVYVSEVRRRLEHPTTVPYRWLVRVPAVLRAFVLLEVVWAWAVAADRHRRLTARHPDRYLGVRFEDLVREPDATLRRLCAFLGVEPEPTMLERTVTSKGAMQGMVGFDAGAAERWRASIGRLPRRVIEATLGRRMRALGYR
ncbi:MAG: sulfotransferase [Chloroflexota bacterium]